MARRDLRWVTHASFAQGIIQDVPRHLLPDNAVWDADNAFIKRVGSIAKRGGTTTALSSGTTIVPTRIATMQSQAVDGIVRGYALGASTCRAFTPGSGTSAVSTIATSCATPGRPFNYGDVIVVPDTSLGFPAPVQLLGGSNSATASYPVTVNSYVVTAGNPTITNLSAGDAAVVQPGWFVYVWSQSTVVGPPKVVTNTAGVYRVISVSGTTVNVEPTPKLSFNSSGASNQLQGALLSDVSILQAAGISGAGCGAAFQGRVVLGNIMVYPGGSYGSRVPNRIMWSLLPTETKAIDDVYSSGLGETDVYQVDGYTFAMSQAYPLLSYIDVQQVGKIVALEPIGQGTLLILGDRGISVLTGVLQTVSATTGSLSGVNVQALSTTVMCLSDSSVQTTPAGVVWASRDGVYLFNGSRLQNLTQDRIYNLWRDTYATATIYGSAVVGRTYILSTSAGSLLVDVATGAWTRASTLAIAGGAQDFSDANRVYAIKAAASASSSTDKIVRLDPILTPASTNTADATGTNVVMNMQTRAFTEGDPLYLKRFRHLMALVKATGTAPVVSIYATPGLEGEEATTLLGTVSVASASPQAMRYESDAQSRACALTFVTSGTVTNAEILEIHLAVNVLRPGRTT